MQGLTKTFGGLPAVSDLDLEVQAGAVYGLIGRNGSGKTTALRLLLGLLQPDAGTAQVLGWSFWEAPRSVRRRVAYVSQSHHLPSGMTLEDLGRCLGRMNEDWDAPLARRLAERWAVPRKRVIGSLSIGEQRKAALLLAFSGRPEVLILDEPAAGFDLVARRELMDQMVEAITQRERCTILLSTHLVADLERLADHVGFLHRGRMVMSCPLEDLLTRTKRVQVIFENEAPPPDFAVPNALRSRCSGPVVNAIVQWPRGAEFESWRSSVNARVQVFPVSLEEFFLEMFTGNSRAGNEPALEGFNRFTEEHSRNGS